jgi:hypothetical protein
VGTEALVSLDLLGGENIGHFEPRIADLMCSSLLNEVLLASFEGVRDT